MKKIFIILTLSLVLFTGNVKAADQYCATLVEKKSLTFNFYNSNKTLYIASLRDSSGKTMPAFCLDQGWSIDPSTANAYVRLATGSSLSASITRRMRIIYNYGRTSDTKTESGQLRYLTAQVAMWVEVNNRNLNDTSFIGEFEAQLSRAIASYYTEKKDQDTINEISKGYRDGLKGYITSGLTYTGNLYVYEYKNGGRYQRFLTGLDGNVCPNDTVVKDPEKTYCPSPNDTIDITTCINSGKEYATCVAENCPNTNTCPNGYGVKVVGNPPVCTNDNQMTTARYSTEMDTSVCGYTIDEGTLETTVGEYCNLYCKEEVYVNYPGGISSPISLGTSIVWPTSTATEHTVWKNLYSLSYRGYKTCTLKVKSEQSVRDKYNTAATFVRNNQRKYESNRINNSCSVTYQPAINQASAELLEARKTVVSAQSNYKTANDNFNALSSDCRNKSVDRDQKEGNYNTQKRLLDNLIKKRDEEINSGGNSAEINQKYSQEISTLQDRVSGAWTSWQTAAGEATNACSNSSSAEVAKNNAASALEAAKRTETEAQTKLESAQAELKNCNNYISSYNMASQIIKELNTCANYSIAPGDLYKFESDTSISYDDGEYGTEYNLNGSTTYSCENCNAEYHYEFGNSCNTPDCLTGLLNIIEERTITVTAITAYSLPDNAYRYVSKKTNQPLLTPIGDYIDVGYSFLPTSYNAKVGKLYNLNVIVNSLGENGKFTGLAQSKQYTCNYSVMNAPTDECVCPDGTEHAGEDLFPIIYDASKSNPMTCADAQLKYCGGSNTEDERYYCPSDQVIDITDCLKTSSLQQCVSSLCPNGSGDKFCPNDSSIKMTACLNSGNSYQFCEDNLCGINDDYHCPKGTFNDGMDIKPCVFANINMGLEAALQYCKDTVCPGGKRIIYRTISLRNPFPGKTAGETYITNQFSIEDHFGRYPGANWNSVDLVRNQILYNRGVKSNEVYEQEPLYSFILDTNTIKEIRKYNDAQEKTGGYADFTLDCNDNGVACISSFIRNPLYGLTGGVCSANSKSDFYSCSER